MPDVLGNLVYGGNPENVSNGSGSPSRDGKPGEAKVRSAPSKKTSDGEGTSRRTPGGWGTS